MKRKLIFLFFSLYLTQFGYSQQLIQQVEILLNEFNDFQEIQFFKNANTEVNYHLNFTVKPFIEANNNSLRVKGRSAKKELYYELALENYSELVGGFENFQAIQSAALAEEIKQAYEEANTYILVNENIYLLPDSIAIIHALICERMVPEIERLKSFDEQLKSGEIDTSLLQMKYLNVTESERHFNTLSKLLTKLKDLTYYSENLYYLDQQIKTLKQVQKTLNAEAIRADDVNGDGVYYAKSAQTHQWGVFQVFDDSRVIIPPHFDSIGTIGWNMPYVRVYQANKVGLHSLFNDRDSLMVPCNYDSLFINEVYYINYSNFMGYRCIVQQDSVWFFIDWRNGKVLSKARFDTLQEARDNASISFAKRIDDD